MRSVHRPILGWFGGTAVGGRSRQMSSVLGACIDFPAVAFAKGDRTIALFGATFFVVVVASSWRLHQSQFRILNQEMIFRGDCFI